MTDKETMKLALKAFEVATTPLAKDRQEVLQAITALKEALAQPEQEPVAWHYPGGKPDQCTTDKAYAEKDPAWTPMYYKHEFVGLTDEEVDQFHNWKDCTWSTNELVRYVEQTLKDKNT